MQEQNNVYIKSPYLRLFSQENRWIAYHSLSMRPMAVSKDVVKFIDKFNSPLDITHYSQNRVPLQKLGQQLKNRSFIIPEGTNELKDWIHFHLPDGILKTPVRALLDGWSEFGDLIQAVFTAIIPFVEQSPNPFTLVIREGKSPINWESLIEALDEQVDRYPEFDWLVFVVITSGRGLNQSIIRRLLPYNIGFRIDVDDRTLEDALETCEQLISGHAKVVLYAQISYVVGDHWQLIRSSNLSHIVGEISDDSLIHNTFSASQLVDKILHLQSSSSGNGLRVSGFWDSPINNFKTGGSPERMNGQLRIENNGEVHLEKRNLGPAHDFKPELLEKILNDRFFDFEALRCRACSILGICPGPAVLRPEVSDGVRCDIAQSIFERYLDGLLHRLEQKTPVIN